MKTLSTYIIERYVNAVDKSSIRNIVDKCGDEILGVLEYGYREIGGCLGMQTKDDLINECDFIKLCRRDNKIVAVSCYAHKKHPNKDNIYTNDRDSNPGRKTIAAAALDGYSGELLKIFKEDFSDKKRNVWGEYSKKAAVLAFKAGGLPVPADIAEKIMVPKQFVDKKEDKYFYTRKINGMEHTKVIIGNHLFYKHATNKKMTSEDYGYFKKLAIKYSNEDDERESLHM